MATDAEVVAEILAAADRKRARYAALLHAMQSGVAAWMMIDAPPGAIPADQTGETSPKHLRTGINAAMSDQGAIAALLIKKGILTEDEVLNSLIEFMQREVTSYEARLSEYYGRKITLG